MDISDCELPWKIHQVKLLTRSQRKWGFCFVDGCPVIGEATQELIERIAFIRHTHYGMFRRPDNSAVRPTTRRLT